MFLRLTSTIALLFTLMLLAACSEPVESEGSTRTEELAFTEMYKPDAEVVYASELSVQSLGDASVDSDTKVVHTHVFSNGEEYTYTAIDGLVVDADIILGTVEELNEEIAAYEEHLTSGDGTITTQGAMRKPGCTVRFFACFGRYGRAWKAGVIYYDVPLDTAFTVAQQRLLIDAMRTIESETNLRFKTATRGDRIRFVKSNSSCSSRLGRVGGRQDIKLTNSCFNGTDRIGSVMHEILHAAGMIHEHQRPDRNSWVRVSGDKNAVRNTYSTETRTPYDYGSIMHYPQRSSLGTITPLRPLNGARLGQRDALSIRDRQAVNQRYR